MATSFKHYPIGRINRVLDWCRDHDWCKAAHVEAESGRVVVVKAHEEDEQGPKLNYFDNLTDLKAWAGY